MKIKNVNLIFKLASVLIKVFGRCLVGVLTVGLLGCVSLFPSTLPTPNTPNPYPDLYKAEDLQYRGKYREAIAKYEQALKKFPNFPDDTNVINISFPTFPKYQIAFCYAKLAEAEGDVSLYVKAEAAVRESYQTAIVASDQADALYLWGYTLFKQARYEEARAKFETLVERLQQDQVVNGRFLGDTAPRRAEVGVVVISQAKTPRQLLYAPDDLWFYQNAFLELTNHVNFTQETDSKISVRYAILFPELG